MTREGLALAVARHINARLAPSEIGVSMETEALYRSLSFEALACLREAYRLDAHQLAAVPADTCAFLQRRIDLIDRVLRERCES